jgi:S-adenosylmethionine:tRNA ribosyltransferase-isomerase
MKTSDFDYQLPLEFIAQRPVEPRDRSRLMVLNRDDGSIHHHRFFEIADFLRSGDTLVFNDSRVIPARLFGNKSGTSVKVELLLLRRLQDTIWETLVKPGKKVPAGTIIDISGPPDRPEQVIQAEVLEQRENGIRTVRFTDERMLEQLGKVPLPPYIHTPLAESERYQTIYSKIKGSVAAPTAGLHFTRKLLSQLQSKGIQFAFVTLHIGLDTFRPVREDTPSAHPIHTEHGTISPEVAELLNRSREKGNRIIAVGTSTVRLIEAASQSGVVRPFSGNIDLFILPGYTFRITDAMITNFHLPRSTLIMLVSAFSGKDFIMKAYDTAQKEGYRFYSFGDAMLII